MSVRWQFYKQQATDTIRNPISGEFFSSEAVGDVAESVVREGLQNTLDARKKTAGGTRQPARVRIYLSGYSGALSSVRARRWFGTLWAHILANKNGLRVRPTLEEACPFFTFEDFGTIGLAGEVDEHRIREGVTNHFLNFFRAEGHSDKDEQDRGSWGVGKTVFPRASQISSFLGLTVRDDGRSLLMGRSILKYHRVDGIQYKSDGYFGVERANDGFILPTEELEILAELKRDFRLKRERETGLSLVVPWYDLTSDDDITREKVLRAVIRDYFYPILLGQVSVAVETPADEVLLDSTRLEDTVGSLGGELSSQLLPIIRLAKWAQARSDSEIHSLLAPPKREALSWSPELLPANLLGTIRRSLAQRERIALKVPLHVLLRDQDPREASFKIFLERSDSDEKPTFIRDQLIIPDVKSPRVSDVRSLVIVDEGALASLLRDAENPAHTAWSPKSANFKDKYKFGPAAIKFVSLCVAEILRLVNLADQKPDPTLTVDFFSIPAPEEDLEAVPARRRRPQDRDGLEPPGPPQPPRSRPRRFRIDTLTGGFAIRPGDPDAPLPRSILVRVAYDVRSGNPLKRYHIADFDLGSTSIKKKVGNSTVTKAVENTLILAIDGEGFSLEVTGFDPNRDLYIKAEVKETNDVD